MDYNKVIELLKWYSDLMADESLVSPDVIPLLQEGKLTHIGFDIMQNRICNVKWYIFRSDGSVKQMTGLPEKRLEFSVSMKARTAKGAFPLRWGDIFNFEQSPYSEHQHAIEKLTSLAGMSDWNLWIFAIAQKIQEATKSARYPLIGYGASHDGEQISKIQALKLYYTFWQVANWNDPYGRNQNTVAKAALEQLSEIACNALFQKQCLMIVDKMFSKSNLLSMFSVNLSPEHQTEKLYFVTDDATWMESLEMLHLELFQESLRDGFYSLFQELMKAGFRYEELTYACSGEHQQIQAYFMVKKDDSEK